ncbi:MAG: hypothetical protein IPO05_17930 [Flavobacteriales bacterium]|nr:hypothetical protein [Flavobacteriales bacterium]
MGLKLWRDAHRLFTQVTKDATYKDAWSLQEQCREQAVVPLTYVPLFNGQLYTNELSGVSRQAPLESNLPPTSSKPYWH